MLNYLSENYKNILMVGDDAQSIYSFRGANYENILRFPQKYPECKVIRLEENYRSNQKILDFTNRLFANPELVIKRNSIQNY